MLFIGLPLSVVVAIVGFITGSFLLLWIGLSALAVGIVWWLASLLSAAGIARMDVQEAVGRMIERDAEPEDDTDEKGALYKTLEAGGPIEFDDEEQAAIEELIEEREDDSDRFLARLLAEGINVPGIDEAAHQVEEESQLARAADALKWLAYRRYEDENYSAAAETCLKSLRLTGNSDEPHPNTAEVWLLLVRIHVSAGRFRAANGLLDEAKRAAKNDDMVNYPHALVQWSEAVSSLEADLQDRRRPRPSGSALVPTSVSEWFDN